MKAYVYIILLLQCIYIMYIHISKSIQYINTQYLYIYMKYGDKLMVKISSTVNTS